MFWPNYDDYTGLRSRILMVEMWARAFFEHPDKAAEVVIPEDMTGEQFGDATLRKWEEAFWAGRDPFEGMNIKAMVAASKEIKKRDMSHLTPKQQRIAFDALVAEYADGRQLPEEKVDGRLQAAEDIDMNFERVY